MPGEVGALFANFESQSWGRGDRERISSGYPNFATIFRRGWADEVDSFLDKWDKLHL